MNLSGWILFAMFYLISQNHDNEMIMWNVTANICKSVWRHNPQYPSIPSGMFLISTNSLKSYEKLIFSVEIQRFSDVQIWIVNMTKKSLAWRLSDSWLSSMTSRKMISVSRLPIQSPLPRPSQLLFRKTATLSLIEKAFASFSFSLSSPCKLPLRKCFREKLSAKARQ